MRCEQWERDEWPDALMRQNSELGNELADLIDAASIHVDMRRQLDACTWGVGSRKSSVAATSIDATWPPGRAASWLALQHAN